MQLGLLDMLPGVNACFLEILQALVEDRSMCPCEACSCRVCYRQLDQLALFFSLEKHPPGPSKTHCGREWQRGDYQPVLIVFMLSYYIINNSLFAHSLLKG